MGEHAKDNKGEPYKTSAGVPLLIRWPNRITKGKVVKSAYSSVDFAPTLLSMLGVNTAKYVFQGIDASNDLFNNNLEISNESQVRYNEASYSGAWAAAMTQRYKFILSGSDIPWLIDTELDPDEIINFYGHEGYDDISTTLKEALNNAIMTYDFALRQRYVLCDAPTCSETNDQLDGNRMYRTCKDYSSTGDFAVRCKWKTVQELCPVSCGLCSENSNGYILFNNTLLTCNHIGPDQCASAYRLQQFCPKSCGSMSPSESQSPDPSSITMSPSAVPSSITSPTESPTSSSPSDVPSTSKTPSHNPTSITSPSDVPSSTASPTETTISWTAIPSASKTPSHNPTSITMSPSAVPSSTASPTESPTSSSPTALPSASGAPSHHPTSITISPSDDLPSSTVSLTNTPTIQSVPVLFPQPVKRRVGNPPPSQ